MIIKKKLTCVKIQGVADWQQQEMWKGFVNDLQNTFYWYTFYFSKLLIIRPNL